MKAWLVAALLTADLLALPAQARMHAGPSQLSAGHRLQGLIAPLDGGGSFATPAGAYSLRRLKSTYAGPAVKLRRASDNATQDINFLGFTGFTGAPIDTAAAAAFCASTMCFYDTWYDQSGNNANLPQATAGAQPAYVADCGNGKPCARITLGSGQGMGLAGVTPAVVTSMGAVVRQSVRGTGTCVELSDNLNQVVQQVSDAVTLSNSSVAFNAPSASLAWHAHIGVMNGASSVINVDGTETGGTVSGVATGGALYFVGGTGSTCDTTELLLWRGYALTAGERAALQANQKSFWGTP